MNLEIDNPSFLLPIIPALSIALNEMLKKVGVDAKWCPIINLVFGGGFSVLLLSEMGFILSHSIIVGLMIGLSAGGFFDLVKYSILRKK
jgi:hypothetical protein